MPEVDGITVLEELNKNTSKYKKPAHTIVFSAFTNEKLMSKASSLGAEYFIVKPIELNSVLNIINQLLLMQLLIKHLVHFLIILFQQL